MGTETAIEWTNATWNPWHGCKKVSQGCKNCYMYRDKKRWGDDPTKVVRAKTTFDAPLKMEAGLKVFTCSWSDWFIEEADEWRADAWKIIKQRPDLTFQILTKRPERIKEHLPADWGDTGYQNVWLGVSVENQEAADKRIPLLVDVPAKVRFLSCEPLLSSLNLDEWLFKIRLRQLRVGCEPEFVRTLTRNIHWIIAGGESGNSAESARPADVKWFRSLRGDCDLARVPFFFKQHGGYRKIDGHWGGRLLDGVEYNEMPSEMPEVS